MLKLNSGFSSRYDTSSLPTDSLTGRDRNSTCERFSGSVTFYTAAAEIHLPQQKLLCNRLN